jgi:hypothetical protein
MAMPTYFGTLFANTDNLSLRGKIIGDYAAGQPIAVAYHPTRDIAYTPWADSTTVRIYDTTNWSKIGQYDFENTFDSPGNHAFVEGRAKTSKDGSLLFVTVAGGVRYVQTTTE